MNEQIKKRLKRTALLSFGALILGGLIAFAQISAEKSAAPSQTVPGSQVGGPFTLVNQDGVTMTEKDFAGKYKLIYFGFTYCPAICPTELQKITHVLEDLQEEGDKIQPLFISVDPERDTPVVIKDYLSLFDKRFVGLTGTVEQIEKLKKDYRIYANKVQDEKNNDYTIDHSSFIYLMSPDDNLISIYRMADTSDYIADDIRQKL